MRNFMFGVVATASLVGSLSAQHSIKVGKAIYSWDSQWGRQFDGKALGIKAEGRIELGNTHGCMVVRKDGKSIKLRAKGAETRHLVPYCILLLKMCHCGSLHFRKAGL